MPRLPRFLVALLVFSGGLFLLLTGYLFLQSQRGGVSHEVRGRIAGFSDSDTTLIVEHEAIPGYMPAMTMPLTVRDTAALRTLDVGDAIEFVLHSDGRQSWITDLARIDDDAVARHPAAANAPRGPRSDLAILMEGDQVPDFDLAYDQDGDPVSLRSYRGEAVALTFIYTRCPLPDFCPLMSSRFQSLHEQLPDSLRDDVQLLSVSFDADYDTPEVLREYGNRYTDEFDNWIFASGTPGQVDTLTTRFGVYSELQDSDEYLHNLTTAVIGPEGTLRAVWRGNDWTVDEVLDELRRALPSS